jgi:hypothetical protein
LERWFHRFASVVERTVCDTIVGWRPIVSPSEIEIVFFLRIGRKDVRIGRKPLGGAMGRVDFRESRIAQRIGESRR